MILKNRFFQIFNFNVFKDLRRLVLQKKLVEQPEIGTNRPYLIDLIEITVSPKLVSKGKIRILFVKNGLSAAQIAERFGVSKSFILSVLHNSDIKVGKVGRSTNPQNYRNSTPPYGYSVRNGHLVPNKSELKICRIVVELRSRQNFSIIQVAKEVEKRGFKNRRGNTIWNPRTIINIFERWNGKI